MHTISFNSTGSLRQHSKSTGFSLIEVTLSLAVVGIGFVSVLGLMGSGLSQYRSAMDTTVTSQIAQRVINDARQADFPTLVEAKALSGIAPDPEFSFRAPSLNAPGFRYFDAQGTEIATPPGGQLSAEERKHAVYQVNVRVRPFANVPRPTTTSKEPQLAQLTVQVAHLHSTQVREVDSAPGPNKDLFKPVASTPVYTYAALVGRNE